MAKLIKASTARKRAEEVDKVALRLNEIAGYIAAAAARGEFEAGAVLDREVEDDVVEALLKAGYQITYPELEWALNTFALYDNRPKNWFQRLLSKFFEATKEEVSVLRGTSRWEEIRISWTPLPEPTEEELDDLAIPF